MKNRSIIGFVLFMLLVGCESECGGETQNSFDIAAMERDDSFCSQPNQKVTLEGYCVCREDNKRYDDETGGCKQCSAPSCDGKMCGDDGCGGSCGECSSGEICAKGLCETCTPSCDGKMCGDDGCGGSCGECPVEDKSIVTPCTCQTAPIGAYPGANRYEARCGSGFAKFELCGEPCGHGGVSWKETCVDKLSCGQVVVGCNCGFPPPGAFPGAFGSAPVCESGVAQILTCNFLCTPQSVAWGAVCACR